MRVPTPPLLAVALLACGGVGQRGATALQPVETAAVTATQQPVAARAAP